MSHLGRRVLVVEDEPLMASLIGEVLRACGFQVESAGDVVTAGRAVTTFDPDLVLLDFSLGDGPSGVDLGHRLARRRPDIALMFLTKHPDLRTAGVEESDLPYGCGYLRKECIPDTAYLLDSIEAVLANRAGDVRQDTDPRKPLANLTPRQVEVLRMIAAGYTNEAIARQTHTSLSSAERWVNDVFRTLGLDRNPHVNKRVEATRIFITAAGVPDRLWQSRSS